ncbi:MAG: carbohydrate kinase family protein [Phycisphaeraceae bacterium]|nr:carbohydrate kinase family protein [Phycisphaeraceae bacterium]
MPSREQIAKQTAEDLQQFAQHVKRHPALVGFDGFVDSIIKVVDTRADADRYTPMESIATLGRRILDAAGKSSNIELVTEYQKLGGNGPILANMLVTAGVPVTYVGTLGAGEIHPVFGDLAQRAACHSLADPGFTDALEFSDGKLMLGKLDSLKQANWDSLQQEIGPKRLLDILEATRLLVAANWTMLAGMNSIWEGLIDQALPRIKPHPAGRRIVFIDLADPAKRTREDLRQALTLLARFQSHADTVLGLNLSEADQVSKVLGLSGPAVEDAPIQELVASAVAIQRALDIHGVVIHPRAGAAAALRNAGDEPCAAFAGPFVRRPRLSTGAGDNFNAGFCIGLLAGMPVERVLCAATATSGFYVREARSPDLSELAAFCTDLPQPQ